MYDELRTAGLVYEFPFKFPSLISQEELDSVRFQSECTYVDDAAFCFPVSPRHNHKIPSFAAQILCIISTVFYRFLFKTNFKPGKTEFAIVVRGRASRKILQSFGPFHSRFVVSDTPFGNVSVKINPIYTHVGNKIDVRGNFYATALHNFSKAKGAYSENRSFLASDQILDRAKSCALRSLVLSHVFYCAGLWPVFS